MDLDKLAGSGFIKQKIQSREKYNKLIIEHLVEYLEMHPQIRFGQALYNLDLSGDLFYEEPIDTYKRLTASMET